MKLAELFEDRTNYRELEIDHEPFSEVLQDAIAEAESGNTTKYENKEDLFAALGI